MSITTRAVVFSVAIVAIGAVNDTHATDPPPCPSSSGGGGGMLSDYQHADTTTDVSLKIWRQSLGLPVVAVSQITLVSDTTVCRRGLNAYNAIVTGGSLNPAMTVNVLRYGTTRYIIGDPSQTVGEWMHETVVDSSFQKIAVAGR